MTCSGKSEQPEAVVVTYERDSIWALANRPLKLDKRAVQARVRKIGFEGKVYRHQQVSNAEAIRLLEHPFGKLPVHRPESPVTRNNEALRQVLLRDLSVDGEKPEQ